MSPIHDAPHVHADDRATWRAWLEQHHARVRGAWLVTWRARSGRVGLDYEAAVEEALCFGWVDSTGGRVDDERGKLYFSPRKVRSPWAASNKARVERLIAAGRMAPAGLAAIERAKANGTWTVLDSVERLEVPADLTAALDGHPPAADNFCGLLTVGAEDDAGLGRPGPAAGDAGRARHADRRGRRPERARPGLTSGRLAARPTARERGGHPRGEAPAPSRGEEGA